MWPYFAVLTVRLLLFAASFVLLHRADRLTERTMFVFIVGSMGLLTARLILAGSGAAVRPALSSLALGVVPLAIAYFLRTGFRN